MFGLMNVVRTLSNMENRNKRQESLYRHLEKSLPKDFWNANTESERKRMKMRELEQKNSRARNLSSLVQGEKLG